MAIDITRDTHCDITMGNDITMDIHCDMTMSKDIAMCTYHGITFYNHVAMNLFIMYFYVYFCYIFKGSME